VPAAYNGSLTPLAVPGSPASCQLTVGGQAARVDYCGAAPGEIIDQLNFAYPFGVPAGSPYVDATLTITGVNGVSGATGSFRLPVPAPTSDQRADRLLQQMTQGEKLRLVLGAGGLSRPLTHSRAAPGDGSQGYRLGVPDLHLSVAMSSKCRKPVPGHRSPAESGPAFTDSAAVGDGFTRKLTQ
jgi:hypothetical protein